jgi:hypothetical protein
MMSDFLNALGADRRTLTTKAIAMDSEERFNFVKVVS